MCSLSSIAAVLAVVPCLVWCTEIPHLKPGDVAPPFVLQANQLSAYAEEILKYGQGNDSNIHGPIVFLALTKRSGFLERLLSDPDCFSDLMENSPDNVNYVFLFYADYGPTTCNKETKSIANQLTQKFTEATYAYHKKK